LATDGLVAPPLPIGSAEAGDVGVIASVTADLKLNLIDYRVARIVVARSGDIYDQGSVERTVLDIEAQVGPGVSGAALLNDAGAIVGIVFAESDDDADAAYALDAGEITAFLDSIDAGPAVEHGRCR
jgi:S1-C subfamily serine protease